MLTFSDRLTFTVIVTGFMDGLRDLFIYSSTQQRLIMENVTYQGWMARLSVFFFFFFLEIFQVFNYGNCYARGLNDTFSSLGVSELTLHFLQSIQRLSSVRIEWYFSVKYSWYIIMEILIFSPIIHVNCIMQLLFL